MQPDQTRPTHSKDRAASPPSDRSATKLLLVSAPTRQKVSLHPEIASRLATGWRVRRATRRIVENDGAKWLVVLERPSMTPSMSRAPSDALTARSRRAERVRKRLDTAGDHDVPKQSSSTRRS
jgi:hypothetical protein